jgi:AcrR family transcriptional regulator
VTAGAAPHRRSGRRSGDSRTRDAILDAARARFAEHGFDGATIRAIAADAGVDPALVHHFYGTKEKLFVEALRFPVVPSELLAGIATVERDRLGETLIRTVLGVWEAHESRSQAEALLRSAVTNERAASMLRSFVSSAILRLVADAIPAEDAEYRASLVASQVVGLGITRFVVGLEPIASASVDDLVAAIGPTVQRYLTDDVRPSARSSTSVDKAPRVNVD